MSSRSPEAEAAAADEDEDGTSLQFNDSLKDLKNLRRQLYSAADFFESSYNRDTDKQFVVESSKDYVAKALVNTVDHLGSVADKLNKFLDQKANDFSAINTQFSCIQQRLCTIEGLVQSRGMMYHLVEIEDMRNHNNKHKILSAGAGGEANLALGKSNIDDVQQTKNSSPKPARIMNSKAPNPPFMRRRKEASPNHQSFSFINKEAVRVRRSAPPHRLAFNLITKRSVSPSPSLNKGPAPDPRRAISAGRTREMIRKNGDQTTETKKSSKHHLFKALLTLHNSKKPIQH